MGILGSPFIDGMGAPRNADGTVQKSDWIDPDARYAEAQAKAAEIADEAATELVIYLGTLPWNYNLEGKLGRQVNYFGEIRTCLKERGPALVFVGFRRAEGQIMVHALHAAAVSYFGPHGMHDKSVHAAVAAVLPDAIANDVGLLWGQHHQGTEAVGRQTVQALRELIARNAAHRR